MSNKLQVPLRPPFWVRLSVTAGNIMQVIGLLVGAGLLYIAAHMNTTDIIRIILMILAWIVIYICAHSLGHYVIGRIVRIQFRGYGIRGTDRPESYGPGIRQLMSIFPMFTVMTEKSSMAKASPLAKALMFAAGEISTTIFGVAAGWYARATGIPGGGILLIVSIVWVALATVLTAIAPKGDYAKAFRALRSG
jgi:hypothetical protein